MKNKPPSSSNLLTRCFNAPYPKVTNSQSHHPSRYLCNSNNNNSNNIITKQ